MLDMDGTVLDLAYDNYMWRVRVPEQYAARHDLSIKAAMENMMRWFGETQGNLEWYCLDHWSERLDLDVLQLHREMDHLIGFLPGALRFLQQVQASSIRVLMVTNSHRDTLELKDDVTGVASFFDGVHSSHDYGYAKEHQEFWHALQEEVGFDPETTLFVDDSQPVLQSAAEYGMAKLVEITQPDTSKPTRPDPKYPNVEAVADLLD
jgi:HAD superfamily hydrolase (TIGR01509 family)